MPAKLHLTADKRVPFAGEFARVVILGPNYTGAAFLMHIRNAPGDTGTPLVSIATAEAGLQGISVTYSAAYVYNDTGATAPASTIQMQIDEATIEALASANPTSAPLVLYYDMHVTPIGSFKRVELRGMFTIDPGTTI